VLKRIKVCQ